MRYNCLRCDPLEINRIDGYWIDDIRSGYTFDYEYYISSVKKFTLYNWSEDLIDKLIGKQSLHRIVLVTNGIFVDSVSDYELLNWYIAGNELHISVVRRYPYYHLYYKYIELFGIEVPADVVASWLELTKDMSINDIEDMRRMLLALAI